MTTEDAPWLNKSNLEKWLEAPVLEVALKDADLKGDNYVSEIYRLNVKTEKGDNALLVKCRLNDSQTSEALTDPSIFVKEEQMYGDTLPKLEKLLRDACQGEFEPLAPKCLYSCKDFLVMDDLSAKGYKMQDRCQGLGLEKCLIVMRTIARFHAASAVLYEQDPEYIKAYEKSIFSEPKSVESTTIYIRAMIKMLIEELETWPAEEWGPYIEKLRQFHGDVGERLQQVCRRNDSEFNVLIHGDLWTNNILFRGDEARLIDFQIVHFTSPGIDLVLFLTTSPTMEVRINHIDKLIQEYHSTLCSTLAALGSRKSVTLEEVYRMYHNKAAYGIFGVISEAAVMTADPNCGFNLDEGFKGNTPGTKMYSEFFKDVVKWEFPILDRLGVFN